MCRTSGQLVRTASRTPARITHSSSARPIAGEAAHRRSRRSTGAVEGLSISVLAIRRGAYGRCLLSGAAGVCPLWRTAIIRLGHAVGSIYVTLQAMRVLVVGSGGVGAAFAAIAQRRPVFTQVVMADVALERAQAVAAAAGRARSLRRRARRRLERGRSGRADRSHRSRRGAERLRPALQRADLRRLPAGAGDLPGHGDDAVASPSRAPPRAAGDDARRLSARAQRGLGAGEPARARRDRRGARPVGHLRPPRRRRAVLEHRRSRRARRRRPRRRGL